MMLKNVIVKNGMNLFQRLVFLYILVIPKQAFGKQETFKAKFTCQELAEQVHSGSYFRFINLPAQVILYVFHGKGPPIGTAAMLESTKDFDQPLTALTDKSGELHITLFKEKDEICASRPLIKLTDDKKCTTEDIAKKGDKRSRSSKENVSNQDYEIIKYTVDWQNKCDQIKSAQVPVFAGSKQVFECVHNDNIGKNSITQWVQEFENINFTISPMGPTSKLSMEIDELDNNTAVVCYQESAHSNEREEVIRIPIRLSPSSSTKSTSSRTYYNDTSKLTFFCEKSIHEQFIFLTKDKVIKMENYSGPVYGSFPEVVTDSTLSCVNIARNPSQIERFISKKETFVYRNDLHVRNNVSTHSLTEPPVTSISKEEPKPLKVGEDITVQCRPDSDPSNSTQSAWQQYFPAENLTYIYPTATSVKMYKIKLTMGEFDNNTILACIKSQNLIEKKKTNVTKLTVLNTTTKDSLRNEKYYNEETSVECDCRKYYVVGLKTSKRVKSYIIQVQPNRHIKAFSNENETITKFTKGDNNSVLYCSCIEIENNEVSFEVTRHVKEIGLLKYQEKKEGESERFSKNSYFFIGGTIIGLIVLAVIFIVFWKCYKSKKTASENNNEDPARITYAELDLKFVPNNRRTIQVNETPYAEIVLHENQPYLQCRTRAENTESPYAN